MKIITSLACFSLLMLSCFSSLATNLNLNAPNRYAEDKAQDINRKPDKVIEFSGVKSGDKVLDLLAGGGYYSELLSQVVGENGEVVLQIPTAYLNYVGKQLNQRLANNRLPNVTKLLSEADNLKLGENRFDQVYLILGLHDMYFTAQGWQFDVKQVMPQVIKAMKKGATLLIVDHNTQVGKKASQAQSHHRIQRAFVINELNRYGFELINEGNFLRNNHDDGSLSVFNPKIRRQTDRFVLLFKLAK